METTWAQFLAKIWLIVVIENQNGLTIPERSELGVTNFIMDHSKNILSVLSAVCHLILLPY